MFVDDVDGLMMKQFSIDLLLNLFYIIWSILYTGESWEK